MKLEQVVGTAVRTIRISRGLTQVDLARAANIDLRYLGSIERGRGNPTVAMLGRLGSALSVHPKYFLESPHPVQSE